MKLVDKIKDLAKELTGAKTDADASKSTNYLTGKEIRAIAKENSKVMFRLEKYKYRKAEESEFTTRMKDDANILEIDNLNTYFFTVFIYCCYFVCIFIIFSNNKTYMFFLIIILSF